MNPDQHAFVVDAIRAHAERDAGRTSLGFVSDTHDDTIVCAEDLVRRLEGYGEALVAQGVGPGDVVLLALNHGLDLVATFLGAMSAGAIPCIFPSTVPKLDPAAYESRLANAVATIRPKALIVEQGFAGVPQLSQTSVPVIEIATVKACAGEASGAAPRRPLHRSEVAFLQLSSGSTGRQRAIPVTHDAVLNLTRARHAALHVTSGDVFVGWVPLYHDLGIIGHVLSPLVSGVPSMLIAPLHWLVRPVVLMEAVSQHRGTVCTMPNFAFTYCAKRITDADMTGLDLTHWRILCNGAEPVRPDSFTAFAARFARWGFRAEAFVSAYGLAENTLTVTATPLGRWPRVDRISRQALRERALAIPQPEEEGGTPFVSCGAPLPNVELQIRSASGAVLGDREVGDVVLRSDCMCTGYFGDADHRSASFRDGWLHTDDVGYTVDGELYVCGRKEDVIIVGGANVYAEDVEAVASNVSGLRSGRVVAFGVPDAAIGSEKIVLVGELQENSTLDPSEIERELRSRIKQALDVALTHVEFVPPGWIMKTTSGKIARWENRSKWAVRSRVALAG